MALGAVLGLVTSLMIVRGTDLTRLMVTMGVALVLLELANKFDNITGGADGLQGVVMGPLLGLFEFDLGGAHGVVLFAGRAVHGAFLVLRRVVHSPLGISLQALRDNRLRLMALGMTVQGRLAAVYTLAGALAACLGCAAGADHRLCVAGRAGIPPQRRRHAGADHRRRRLAVGRADRRHRLQADARRDLSITPQYWTFWIGLFLVVLVLVGRERLLRPWTWLAGGAAMSDVVLQTEHLVKRFGGITPPTTCR
jgi:branched-chain amino acid transport system permease protein